MNTYRKRYAGEIVDERGRVLGSDYERNPAACIKCGQRRTQVNGLWCCECYAHLCADAVVDWSRLTQAAFEYYATRR